MKVADAMTRDVRIAVPEMTVQDAARLMVELEAGALPVIDGDRLRGMSTDRDMAVRVVALGLGLDTPVADAKTSGARFCHEDDTLEDALGDMGDHQVRRMPVLDRAGRIVGILSLGDAAPGADGPAAADALEGLSAPGGGHSQTNEADAHGGVAPTIEADGVPGVLHFTHDEPSRARSRTWRRSIGSRRVYGWNCGP